MLRTRLKTVYYYGNAEQPKAELTDGQTEIRVLPAVDTLVQESLALLPAGTNMTYATHSLQSYAAVRGKIFEDLDQRACLTMRTTVR